MINLEDKTEANLEELSTIALVFSADNQYAMPLSVTVRSVLENLKNRRVTLFILDGGIKETNKNRILKSLPSEKCEVNFIPITRSLIEGIEDRFLEQGTKELSIATYYRLLIPELLPHRFNKVIYLDSDLIIQTDLGKLWDTDLGENYVLAVQDMWTHTVSHPAGLSNYEELGILPNAKYFNAGVLVINLEKWRKDNISGQAIDYLKRNRGIVRWHDQEVLNAILVGQWGELNPAWNVNIFLFYTPFSEEIYSFPENVYNSLIRSPYIIHFTSEDKPWLSAKIPCKEQFLYYLDLTDWRGFRPEWWRRIWQKLDRKARKIRTKLKKFKG